MGSGDNEKDALDLLSKQHTEQQKALQQRLAEEREHKARAEALAKSKDKEHMCKICLERATAITFVPCGHLCCCEVCGMDKSLMSCVVCRKSIEARQRVFKG